MLYKIFCFLRRDFLIQSSYKTAYLLGWLRNLFTLLPFFFIAKLLGKGLPVLAESGGDYFSFVLIGIMMRQFLGKSLNAFSQSFFSEQAGGTLEAMLLTPTRLPFLFVMISLWDLVLSFSSIALYILFGVCFFGVQLSWSSLPTTLLILLISTVAFYSLGILSTSFLMVFKKGDPFDLVFGGLSSLLGGVYFPISLLPDWMEKFSFCLPITYALKALRLSLLQGASLQQVAFEMVVLAAMAVLFFPLSLLSFRWALQRVKQDGSLVHY